MTESAVFEESRKKFHAALLESVLHIDDKGAPSNADGSNLNSKNIALGIMNRIGETANRVRLASQTSGNKFEEFCAMFLVDTFLKLEHLRPGIWSINQIKGRSKRKGGSKGIADFEQYAHLIALESASKNDAELAAALGSDYTITPDIVISRATEEDSRINAPEILVNEDCARYASLRKINGGLSLLHASISCKWTIRSDRAQNSRTEALNLIRNRKGRLPHIVVVTGEPLPSRIASIALGTGDIDCVYHFALHELMATTSSLGLSDAEELLHIMVDGKRLKDISDLPLDLAI